MGRARYWLWSSLDRIFPNSTALKADSLELVCARGEQISFQACVRNESSTALSVRLLVSTPEGLETRTRRVGYVPVAHHTVETDESELDGAGCIPGYVPDPLFPEDRALVGPYETQSFWVTVFVFEDVKPGSYNLALRFADDDSVESELTARLVVHSIGIEPRRDFPITHWLYADALCDWYNVEAFDERFWSIVEPYMQNLVSHGSNCVCVPMFTPPTDGVKRPTQLLQVSQVGEHLYGFDFADVRRWVRLARGCGATTFEWMHLFTQWGVQHALRIYRSNYDEDSLLWPSETPATSHTYRSFLSQFLPRFKEFLQSENLLDRSIFHLSDEPREEHVENYRAARAMLREMAPWMKIADALSDVRYGKEGLTDTPIACIEAARAYAEVGVPSWVYFCCEPRGPYLNRFLDTPLAKLRMAGWLFYRLKAAGFLHWGYNYWYKRGTRALIDPFTELSGGAWPVWACGDTFVVYPGPDGPLDSIRWEVFRESMQDYALLQTAGIDPDDALLSQIKGYDEFPKTGDWIADTRLKILRGDGGNNDVD